MVARRGSALLASAAVALLLAIALALALLLVPSEMMSLAPLRQFRFISSSHLVRARSLLLPHLQHQSLLTSPHNNAFTTTATATANMTHDSTSFKEAVQFRRSIYQLTKKSTIPDSRIKEILTTAIEDVPSSFNSQSARLVVLLKEEHTKFWNIVETILKGIVPEDQWEHTGGRLKGFHEAYGTVLFYEDPDPVHALQKKFPMYADKFPQWSEHTSAMHQYMLWTAFEAEGLGCNLQHYNPLPDQKVSETWGVPLEWSLKAQLVFGTPAEGAREGLAKKDKQPVEERLKIYGA